MTTAATSQDPEVRSGAAPDGSERAERVARLLDEVRGATSDAAWRRVEDIVVELLALHREGFERLLARVREAGGSRDRLDAGLCDDALVTSLLVLHGLHPVSLEARIERALARVRPYLGSHAGDVEIVALRADGVLELRFVGSCNACPSSRATLEGAIESAIGGAAPEIERVELVEANATERLVQLGGAKSRAP